MTPSDRLYIFKNYTRYNNNNPTHIPVAIDKTRFKKKKVATDSAVNPTK